MTHGGRSRPEREERGFTPETLRAITALAEGMRSQEMDTVTASEVEEIGREVGLSPDLVRQAMEQLRAMPTAPDSPGAGAVDGVRRRAPPVEFGWMTAAYAGVLLLAAWVWGYSWDAGWTRFWALGGSAPVAAILGFVAGRTRTGLAVGAALALGLVPSVFRIQSLPPLMAALYALLAVPAGAWLGLQGARVREAYLPLPRMPRPGSRGELRRLLFALQQQLEEQQQDRAFLSVDVVESTVMKRAAPALAVEHSFEEYRAWVEETARACGGVDQVAAGDGAMCMFPSPRQALEAARRLQAGVAAFNRDRNLLADPFRIRWGISAGAVALDPDRPLGHLQSPVLDRAAALQKRAAPGGIVVSEEVAALTGELGPVAPLPDAGGDPAYTWSLRPE